MKLLTRSTYYFLVISLLVMIVTGIVFYYTIRTIIYNQIDDSLITEKTIIQNQIVKTDLIPDFTASFGHLIEVKLLDSSTTYSQIFRDTDIYDVKSGSYLPFRHITFSDNTPLNTGYSIDIYQVLDENTKLLDNITLGMIFLFIALFIVSIVVNYLISKKIWRPFYMTVEEASRFNVLSDKALNLPDTSINEFMRLNKVIEQMTRKMRSDYLNLKEYNENSSHEIQTPLAIIRSKLDILMQTRNLSKESLNLIKSINEATTRLFKLNQGLLIISKIENSQFPDIREVSLKRIVESCLANYEEILVIKKIKVETQFSGSAMVKMNETLAEILVSNLLGNAVRYNTDSGFIFCQLTDSTMTIRNSGPELSVDPEQLFNRFVKGSDSHQSVGLGLSIVKKISDHYNMHISYTCSGTVHEIKLYYQR